ncbi:uncharacterized protein CIMG_04782 [Coccidioides immitis RS]|uniref:Uncharacterized protein n=1 Tax=Coccidioides immitis (strain RS) TaxID=246410 RepID=J3KE78_COCIM|nr:uncharacterized protein CIMG_04782 [Coccidioides immitis RS]EAS33758.3 hypothetical protein CIMG_04782 [Coccidioides immitis RS]
MPIPTRWHSLRDPLSAQRRKPAGQDTATPTGTSRPGLTSRPTRTTSVSTASVKPPSHAHTTSEGSVSAASTPGLTSRRSFLPRGNPAGIPANRTVTAPLKVQIPEPQTKQSRDAQSGVSPSRRNSVYSPVKRSGGSASAAESRVGDGKKQQQQRSTEGSSSGQAKTGHLPTTRLDRSASLRQPATSRVASATMSHARHRSQVFNSGNAGQAGTTHRQDKTATDSQPAASRLAKPQFNTYQQQYSPKKPAAKPSMSTLSMAAGESNGAVSLPPHVPLLQTELLQLYLLHSQALQTKRQWETSADTKCRKLHESVVTTYRSVLSDEQSVQQHRNIAAIDQFAAEIKASNSRYDFLTQIQMLSKVILEVSDLTESQDGRYNIAVREFEEWSSRVMQVRQHRSQAKGENSAAIENGLRFINSLSDRWRNDVASLSAKLELCSRELDCLEVIGPTSDDKSASDYDASALVRAVRGHKVLIQAMIEELEIMAKTEAEAAKMERAWVKRRVESLRGSRCGGGGVELAIPVWKQL